MPSTHPQACLPYLNIKFREVPMHDDFISPEGSLCRKESHRQARMLDSEDAVYLVGESLPFSPEEIVEYTPRSGM